MLGLNAGEVGEALDVVGEASSTLLEKRAQWEAAIAVYEKLAAANGPMKNEFENTLSRRRLEHFLW